MISPPIPNYPSDRLVGLELEFDAGGSTFRCPETHPGWSKKTDGSLRNGYEFVLEPALKLPRSKSVIEDFLRNCDKSRMNVAKNGGYHIHVQAHDYDEFHFNTHNLVRIYAHFQPVINLLVGKSRVNNTFCPPYHPPVSRSELIAKFQLNKPANNRQTAKGARSYSVVNCAMMRCVNPDKRTLEFRQGSTSKRFECVWGWGCLMVALVDIAKTPADDVNLGQPTLANFVKFIADHERRVGSENLADWIQWRHDYLNSDPTDEQVSAVVAAIGIKTRGIFHISRVMDVNLAVAGRIIDRAKQLHLISEVASGGIKRYRTEYAQQAAKDLVTLEEAAKAREQTILPPPPPIPT